MTSRIAVILKSNIMTNWACDELAFGCSFNVEFLSSHQFEARIIQGSQKAKDNN